MKKTDRILIGIVIGIVLLVVIAFVVALISPKPAYQDENTPGGIAFNYLFALQQKDYERAYGYLSPFIVGYPRNAVKFAEDIHGESYWFNDLYDSSVTLEVDSVRVNGKSADVRIRQTQFYEGDLFNSSQSTYTFYMILRQDETGQWKIAESEHYWCYCWKKRGGCN